MMSLVTRTWSRTLCCLLLSCPLLAGVVRGGSTLAYRFVEGSRFELVSTTHIDAPVVGAIDAAITSKVLVVSATPAGSKTAHDVTSRSPGHPDYHLALGCVITPVGQVQDISGIDPSDPTQALIAKNLAVGLPTLPGAPVEVGTTWSTEKPIYLPPVSVSGVPSVLRIRSKYTVTAIGDAAGQRTATVHVDVVESPGQSTTVKAAGTWVLEHDTGRPITGVVAGVARLRIALVPTNCPFRLDVASH